MIKNLKIIEIDNRVVGDPPESLAASTDFTIQTHTVRHTHGDACLRSARHRITGWIGHRSGSRLHLNLGDSRVVPEGCVQE
jgi:hypothetical protein